MEIGILVVDQGFFGQPFPPYAKVFLDDVSVKLGKYLGFAFKIIPERGVFGELLSYLFEKRIRP